MIKCQSTMIYNMNVIDTADFRKKDTVMVNTKVKVHVLTSSTLNLCNELFLSLNLEVTIASFRDIRMKMLS